MSHRAPIAYLRRSSSNTANGAGRISYAVQERSVLDLARQHGDTEPELITEWGRSGAAREGSFGGVGRGGKRRAYAVLRERIAAGEVTTLYAYSLSRLARSTKELLELCEACADAGTSIQLAKEGALDFASPHGRLYLTVLAAVATFEAELARERAMDRVVHARDNGKYLGEPPMGWQLGEDGTLVHADDRTVVDAVMDAFWRTGTYTQAALLLNTERRVKPVRSGKGWHPAVVRTVVNRESGTRPAPGRRGSRTHATDPLARLLFCKACGGILTPAQNTYRTKGPGGLYRGWRCFTAHTMPGHPRPFMISERRFRPALEAEAARLQVPHDRVVLAEARAEDLALLDARRVRLVDALEAGSLTRIEIEPRLATIAAERARLEASSAALVTIPPAVDWGWPADRLGPVLAAIFERIVVDIAAGTFEASWRVPEWRSPVPAESAA